MSAIDVPCVLPKRTQDLTGQRFGKWTVTAFSHVRVFLNHSNRQRHWAVKCDCGNRATVQHFELVKGKTLSCGCRKTLPFARHQMTKEEMAHPLYKLWCWMRNRVRHHKRYKDRGIKIDPQWDFYRNFYEDMLPTWKPGLSLDRIDNNGPYSKENCRWADHETQMNNTEATRHIIHNGEKLSISQWARKLGLSTCAIARRIADGWPLEQALSAVRYNRHRLPMGTLPKTTS